MPQIVEKTLLIEAGLTNKEADTYLALLRFDMALASEIGKSLNTSRTHIYDTLEPLIEKGLVSYVIKNGKKHFKAASPSKVLDYLREQRELIKKKEEKIKGILPNLLELQKITEKRPSVEMYEGPEGLKTILNDVIRTKPKEWLDFTSGVTKLILPYFMDHWEKRRADAGIKARIIFNDTKAGRQRAREVMKFKLLQVRFFPKGFESPSHIYVYSDKIAIMLWSKDFPFGILVQNKEIANRFREFFDWFWGISKK